MTKKNESVLGGLERVCGVTPGLTLVAFIVK